MISNQTNSGICVIALCGDHLKATFGIVGWPDSGCGGAGSGGAGAGAVVGETGAMVVGTGATVVGAGADVVVELGLLGTVVLAVVEVAEVNIVEVVVA